MPSLTRRRFLRATAAASVGGVAAGVADLGFLLPLSHAAAAETTLDPDQIRYGRDLAPIVRLVRDTPREDCVRVFIGQLEAGLSYKDFLSSLLLASLERGDPHQVAQVYSAHRISTEARTEERLLPLFWVLDRIKGGFEEAPATPPSAPPTDLPAAGRAPAIFDQAIVALDPDRAERALLAIARDHGARSAMSRLWLYGARRTAGTLGHHPIMVANIWRTLDAMNWQHADHVLRYLAGALATNDSDRTYAPNLARIERLLPTLPADWASTTGRSRAAALDLYNLMRHGDANATCDFICAQLSSAKAKAGTIWDAIHLVAADLLVRYKTGGTPVGGMLIHAVTSTNALRFGFECSPDPRARLLMTLQAAAALGEIFIRPAQKENELRNLNLLDLKPDGDPTTSAADVFAVLPFKGDLYTQKHPSERDASDAACRAAFTLLSEPKNEKSFCETARTFLCTKATYNPHDMKYPAAAFEDAAHVSPEWRPYLLAASVHALHGPNSPDAKALTRAREALKA